MWKTGRKGKCQDPMHSPIHSVMTLYRFPSVHKKATSLTTSCTTITSLKSECFLCFAKLEGISQGAEG